jgi:hypothetical protein
MEAATSGLDITVVGLAAAGLATDLPREDETE